MQLEQISWRNNFPLGLIMTTVKRSGLILVSVVCSFLAWLLHKDDMTQPGLVFCLHGMTTMQQWGVLTADSSKGERHVVIFPYSGAERGQPLPARRCFRIVPSPSFSPQIRSNRSVRGHLDSILISWKRSQLLLFDLNYTVAHTPIRAHTHTLKRECYASHRSLAKAARFAAQISG